MNRFPRNITILAAASLAAAAPLFATGEPVASNSIMLAAINNLRAQARTCPGGKSFSAASPLTPNTKLDSAAQAQAAPHTSDMLMPDLGAAGYLAFSAATMSNSNYPENAAPDVKSYTYSNGSTIPAAPDYWIGKQASCEAIMNPVFTEAGIGVVAQPNFFTRMSLVLAAPYTPSDAASYKLRMFNELNRIRATGVDGTKYPGALCSSGPLAALKWNDKMAQAAQFHSDDYASKGVFVGSDNSPHTGTAGDTPDSRVKAAGCTAGGGENVNFNYGATPEAAVRSWLTMSSGHCGNVVNSTSKVAGFGIADSAALQGARSGPFVTFNLGADTGCTSFTKTAPDPAAAVSVGCSAEPNTKSLPSSTHASVSFTNQTAATVRLWWIDFNGKRSLARDTIAPSGTYSSGGQQNTYVDHYFMATNTAGACIGLYKITGSGVLSIQ